MRWNHSRAIDLHTLIFAWGIGGRAHETGMVSDMVVVLVIIVLDTGHALYLASEISIL